MMKDLAAACIVGLLAPAVIAAYDGETPARGLLAGFLIGSIYLIGYFRGAEHDR